MANDVDAAQILTYTLEGSTPAETTLINNLFQIDGTGAITVKTGVTSGQLNFELKPSYTFTVRATDNGSPVLSGSAGVTVNLTDVNEPGPTVKGVRVNSTAWAVQFADFVDDGVVNSSTGGFVIPKGNQANTAAALDQHQPSSG